MPVTIIGPDEYVTLEYRLRKSGPVEFEIAAELPVRTYVVRPEALKRFEEGSQRFKYWGGFPDPRKLQRQKVWIPFSGRWYLIISNPGKGEDVEVEYDVYF